MQGQTEFPVKHPAQNFLTSNLEHVETENRTFAKANPEDFKGLHEWVSAKRRREIVPEYKCGMIYFAPWRVG
jgi:hypothetical protein